MNTTILTAVGYKLVKAAWNSDTIQTFVHETIPEAIGNIIEIVTDAS